MTVVKSSRKSSTQRCTTQNRQKSVVGTVEPVRTRSPTGKKATRASAKKKTSHGGLPMYSFRNRFRKPRNRITTQKNRPTVSKICQNRPRSRKVNPRSEERRVGKEC